MVFNGKRGKKPVLYGQIYSAKLSVTSYTIPFLTFTGRYGVDGTLLRASLPRFSSKWGYVTGIELTISRRYRYKGRRHSFISSGCPAPRGFTLASFPLARTSFAFDGGTKVSSTLTDSCKVRG